MACLLLSGATLGCKDNTGGIQKFYVANYSAATITYNTQGVITGATGINGASAFFTFEQRNEVGEFNQEGAHSVENGTNFWTQTANLTFYKNQAGLRDLLYTLAQARVLVIALDQNGKYFLMGQQNGADVTASSLNAGKAYGDLNGSVVTLTAKEPSPAREIAASTFATFTVNTTSYVA